jgi:hypothetical protein
MILLLALIAVPDLVHASPRLSGGGIVGVTLGPSEYFPAFLGGLVGEGDVELSGHFTLGVVARAQLYRHKEEEDYGSWGSQQDLSAAVRISLFDENDTALAVNPFLSARAGGAILERIPFREDAPNDIVGGYIVGISIGIAFPSTRDRPPLRAALSFDRPSFTTRDDKLGPAWELSLSVVATFGGGHDGAAVSHSH